MKRLSTVLLLILMMVLPACGQKEAAPTWQEQYDLGIRYLSEGNYEEAIIAFTAAIEIDPKQAEAYIGRGDAYLAGGETAETLEAARNDYALAIELDGVNAEAYLRLANIYTRQGDDEAAMTLLQQALERMGEDSDIAAALEQLAQKLAADAIPEIGPAVEPLPAARTEERYGGEVVEYDANDRLIRSFIRLDNGTLYWEKFYLYDAAGLLASTREIQYALHVSGNPPEEYVDCEFDGLGRLIKRVDQNIQLGEGVTFVDTTTYHYNGTQVEVTIDGSEPETDIPTWHWSVSYDMSDPLHAVQTGNRGYGYYVELTEYDWVDADPVINFFGGTVKQSAYDGNSNQLPWSENWYFGVDQHPEWRYQP